ncbi:hypothetical protein FJ250_12280 [bacterium]|nr:hypothetical protein [bacterium]
MHADLANLIHLQQIDTGADAARRQVADEPLRRQEFDDQLAAAQLALDTEKQRLAANQAARRDIEKELAVHQGRLAKYKDQLMAVKTNREYQAMQKEIETAGHEIQVFEERLLERMIDADTIAAHIKQAERTFADTKATLAEAAATLSRQVSEARASLEALAAERTQLVAQLPAALLTTYERIVKHRGAQAVVEVRDGRCSACQVRVRPQMASDLRRHDSIFQCESCQRIFYAP